MRRKFSEAIERRTFILPLVYVLTVFSACIAGRWFADLTPVETISTMGSLLSSSVSFGALYFFSAAPLLLTAVVACCLRDEFLLPIVFLEIFTHSYCSCILLCAFPGSGWLLCGLCMFTRSLATFVYLWLWGRRLVFRSSDVKKDLIISAFFVFLILLADMTLISPFTTSLFIH